MAEATCGIAASYACCALCKILSDLGAPSMCLTMALLQLEANDSASCIPLSEEEADAIEFLC